MRERLELASRIDSNPPTLAAKGAWLNRRWRKKQSTTPNLFRGVEAGQVNGECAARRAPRLDPPGSHGMRPIPRGKDNQ